jgi:DNA invertase Pin-like site-specific DNA recombinase
MSVHPASDKLTPSRLARKAVVYLRQSTENQVRNNKQSQRLQYSLAERARALGFTDVEVIDCDLGSSAAVGAAARVGFERLLAQVAVGNVGIVLSREVSRLSRTDKDWCHLLELCQLFDTLIADHDQVYDLSLIDDQLILGIKGTMSVVELKVLRMRMQHGMEEKARRGELIRIAPPGYVLDADNKLVKDPDARVRDAIHLIFRRFKDAQSVQGVVNWFRRNNVEVPVNKPKAGRFGIVWQLPSHGFILHVLRSPFYAGAYYYGQRQTQVVLVDGKPVKRRGRRRTPEECRVFIREHHEGYVDWPTHLEIKATIEKNAVRAQGRDPIAAIRTGRALLVGLVRCGICGRRLRVHYTRHRAANGGCAYYLCHGTRSLGGPRCMQLSVARADKEISAEILRAISPLGVEAAMRAADKLAAGADERVAALQRQLEECEYGATRAFEQYNAVDARNRLVAAELERRWNGKLDDVARLKSTLEQLKRESHELTAADRTTLLALGRQFADTWEGLLAVEMKKKIIRCILEEVVAVPDFDERTLRYVLHWKGGAHSSMAVAMPRARDTQRTAAQDLDLIRKMAARGYGDQEIARVLSAQGRCTGKGRPWTAISVGSARRLYDIKGSKRSTLDDNLLTLTRAAEHCGVSNTTIKSLVELGLLPCVQVAPFAPWEIRKEDLDAKPVRDALERLRKTGKLMNPGRSSKQQALDLE